MLEFEYLCKISLVNRSNGARLLPTIFVPDGTQCNDIATNFPVHKFPSGVKGMTALYFCSKSQQLSQMNSNDICTWRGNAKTLRLIFRSSSSPQRQISKWCEGNDCYWFQLIQRAPVDTDFSRYRVLHPRNVAKGESDATKKQLEQVFNQHETEQALSRAEQSMAAMSKRWKDVIYTPSSSWILSSRHLASRGFVIHAPERRQEWMARSQRRYRRGRRPSAGCCRQGASRGRLWWRCRIRQGERGR